MTIQPRSASIDPPAKARRHLPGEEGVWVFIFGDMLVFAVFFGVIVYTRGEDPALFQTSQAHLNQALGALNTLVLLTSSLFVARGVQVVRGLRAGNAPRLFAGALASGVAFIAVKALEYGGELAHERTPATNDFFLYFYVFTGIHLLHVVIGIAVLGFVIRVARRPLRTTRDVSMMEAGASYWHMVDLLWIALFTLLYLMS